VIPEISRTLGGSRDLNQHRAAKKDTLGSAEIVIKDYKESHRGQPAPKQSTEQNGSPVPPINQPINQPVNQYQTYDNQSMGSPTSEPIPGGSGEENNPSSRYTYSRRARNDTRDFKDPDEMRGIIQSMEEQIDTMRKEHRQGLDAIMQMLADKSERESGPNPLRDGSDPISISSSNTPRVGGGLYDEIHPSVEEGVEFEGGGYQRTIPLPPLPQLNPYIRGPIRQTNTLPRNTSVPMSHMTYSGPPRLSKSIPETDPLDDGKKPTFIQWKASIEVKFQVNTDHFDSELFRCMHVWLKTTGLAQSYLTPRFTSKDNKFTSADEMIAFLESYFTSGDEKDQAQTRFYAMHMQDEKHPQEDFLAFKTRFVANALEGDVAPSEWFPAMWSKVIPRIRIQNVGQKEHWQGDFSRMAQYLVRVETERARPENRPPCAPMARKASALIKKSPYATNTRASSSALVPYQPQARTSTPQFTRTAPRQLVSESDQNRTSIARAASTPSAGPVKCYRCGGSGHYKSDCPNPASINEMDSTDGHGDDDDTTIVEEETDENQEGNDEA
jgi:hypothetical protein